MKNRRWFLKWLPAFIAGCGGSDNVPVYTVGGNAVVPPGGGGVGGTPNITVPDPPVIGTATGGNGQATVTFTAPANNGGAPITSYTVTASSGGFHVSGPGSPLVVTGLTNGTAYSFTVTATNSAGTSAPSQSTNIVTPGTVPGVPTAVSAAGGNTQAIVAFTAPGNNGGAPITSYTATSTPGGFHASAGTSPITVTGLANGTSYTFTVTATNSYGTGPASSPSNAVIPGTVPGAPTIGTATAGNTQATIVFTPPVNNGGVPITSYTATSNPGGIHASAASSPITVGGLTNGTAYTFTVTATNSYGTGPASLPSNIVTPTGSGVLALYAPASGSPATNAANATYVPALDYYGFARSGDRTVGSVIVGSTASNQSPTTSPQGISYQVGADPTNNGFLNVQQSSPSIVNLSAAQVSSAGAFQSAVNGLAPGTTAYMPAGNYNWGNATSNISVNGSATNWIIVKPAAGATVTITGPGYSLYPAGGTPAIVLTGSYISFEGGLETGASWSFTQWGDAVYGNGGTHHIRVKGWTVSYTGSQAIAFFPSGNTFCSHVEVSDCTISYASMRFQNTSNSWWDNAVTVEGSYVTIARNHISYSYGEDIFINAGQYFWIVDNVTINAASCGIYISAVSQVLCENNLVQDLYTGTANQNFWANKGTGVQYYYGIALANEQSYVGTDSNMNQITVRNNVIWETNRNLAYANFGGAINLNNLLITNNTIVGANTSVSPVSNCALEVDAPLNSNSVVISNNIFMWTGGGSSSNFGSPSGLSCQNNLWFNVSAGSFSGTGDITGQDPLLRLYKMAVTYIQHIADTSGTSPFTTGSFSVTVGHQVIVFVDEYNGTGRTLSMTGGGGTYTIANPPGSYSGSFHTLAVFYNASNSGGSQTATITSSTAGDGVVGMFFEYSGAGVFTGNANQVVNPGTGAGAITGTSITVASGSLLLALCADTTNGSNTITGVGGTQRTSGSTFCVQEYSGSGGSIQPSFTVTTGTGTFDVVQILLDPPAVTAVTAWITA